ncbi:hypothetical protein GCM10025779_11450 [Arthrobacter cryoconiti]
MVFFRFALITLKEMGWFALTLEIPHVGMVVEVMLLKSVTLFGRQGPPSNESLRWLPDTCGTV